LNERNKFGSKLATSLRTTFHIHAHLAQGQLLLEERILNIEYHLIYRRESISKREGRIMRHHDGTMWCHNSIQCDYIFLSACQLNIPLMVIIIIIIIIMYITRRPAHYTVEILVRTESTDVREKLFGWHYVPIYLQYRLSRLIFLRDFLQSLQATTGTLSSF
jgi:hypothetical protein